MSEPVLVVKRWTRYGKDRLYVSTESGERVGWCDLLTGESIVEMSEFTDAFQEALARHQRELGEGLPAGPSDVASPVMTSTATSPTEPPAPLPSPAAAAVTDAAQTAAPTWTDLALNRPGQGVRAEAESLLAEMKEQSKVGTFLKRAFDVKTDERAFRVGAAGEEAVGPRLGRLVKRGWKVLHSVPVGKGSSDIDHLLIGPGGVYCVNTKNHPGGKVWVGEHAIRVNGQPTHYLRNSRFEAERVSKALHRHLGEDIVVRPVLVFLTGTVVPNVTIKQMPDVLVLDRMDVPGIFKRATTRLDEQQVERIYEVARRSTTWK